MNKYMQLPEKKTTMASIPMRQLPERSKIYKPGNNNEESDDGSSAMEDSGNESVKEQGFRKKRKKRGTWLATTFKKKHCVQYVADPGSSVRACFCGRPRGLHIRRPQPQTLDRNSGSKNLLVSQANISSSRVDLESEEVTHWNEEEHLVETPTDAYGEIHFKEAVNRLSTSKFVRLSDRTDMSMVLKLMTKYWSLHTPQLVISLTGGGRSFKLNEQDKETFSRGVIKAAFTTKAWIITSGSNAGVPKIVGSAVQSTYIRDWISDNKNVKKGAGRPKLVCLGLAPWGYVDGSHQLLTRRGTGSYPAEYKVNPVVMKGRRVPLNPDHTHFILIDNGLMGEPAYGGEIVMRAMIEEAIAAPKEENGLGLPVVLVVLEGGVDTLLNVKNAVLREIPTVLCDGSGRAADILAFAHNRAEGDPESRTLNEENIEILREKLSNSFNVNLYCNNMTQLIADVIECIKVKKLLTVFQMDKGENADLDLAILIALLKAQAATPTYKLALALSWNRVDMAERKIFVDDQYWAPGSLDPFIMQALMQNQVDFLRLFLEQGVIMKDFLTVSRLRRLYNSVSEQHSLRSYVSLINNTKASQPIFLYHISRLVRHLLGFHSNWLYSNDKPFTSNQGACLALWSLSSFMAGSHLLQQSQEEYIRSENGYLDSTSSSMCLMANSGMHFMHPFKELFLCAVLMGRMEMAEFFWERLDDSISAGIAASTMLKGIAAISTDSDDILKAQRDAGTFEQLAINVMDECFKTDETFTEKLIMCPIKTMSGKSVLTMASEADNRQFIAHPCAQSVVAKTWLAGVKASNLFIILGILCPLFIFRLKFNVRGEKRPSRLKKLQLFFMSPATKFWSFVLSYTAFLLLYTYVMLETFGPEPSVPEMVLFGWILTMIVEEIRQSLIPNSNQTMKQRFREWHSSEWNIMDLITAVNGLAAFILHWFPAAYKWSQAFYALNCFLYYTRVLRLFSFSEKLGPIMVMIRKMVFEMILFLCILFVFLMGYGVASNVLIYPHLGFGIDSIKNIFFMPYFQIYGNLFLEVLISDGEPPPDCEPSQPSCIQQHVLLPFMLGAYLLLGNVLLLNLLIAIFSSVYDEVQTNSLEVWKFELYFLVIEFEDRPTLPPPFTILEHAFYSLRWAWRKVCANVCMKSGKDVLYLSKKMTNTLRNFEKDCSANYRRQKTDKKSMEVPERLTQLENSLKELDKLTEKTNDQLQVKLQKIQNSLKDILHSSSPPKVSPSPRTSNLSMIAETSGDKDYSGARQRLQSLERRRSKLSLHTASAVNAKQREASLLCQLNEEMVHTSPNSLMILESGSDRSSISSGHISKKKNLSKMQASVHPKDKLEASGKEDLM
ncbi:transient receptor potential cation channel subfamily M member 3-like [Asterias rubens]|uniref:transient receptor potential cation channel subfamily M member 3-like n=1 Tax=Asterias rubens TaxID=7604 RepID=UPI001454F071|nr:transient receptor potential cation channel subfamily M member 3-like [Asterias rubens]